MLRGKKINCGDLSGDHIRTVLVKPYSRTRPGAKAIYNIAGSGFVLHVPHSGLILASHNPKIPVMIPELRARRKNNTTRYGPNTKSK